MNELSKDDIVVLVFTSALNLHERALSCQNTWLRDFKYGYLIGGNFIDPDLKMISAGDFVGEDYASASDKQYYGLKKLYEMFPQKKWFFITGCDAYLFAENLTATLQEFDSDKDYFVGGDFFKASVCGTDFFMPRGGPGFALSRSLVKKIIDNFDAIMSKIKTFDPWLQSACDWTLCYFILTMFNVKATYAEGFYTWPPYRYPGKCYGNECGENVIPNIKKPVAFHMLSIREMYILSSGKKLSYKRLSFFCDKIQRFFSFKFKTKSFFNKLFYKEHALKGYYQ